MSTGLFVMAEREGFEPSMGFKAHTPLAGERLRPLGHLSEKHTNENMVRMGGVEPPTAWFVARYSIQLSYIRKSRFSDFSIKIVEKSIIPVTISTRNLNMVRMGGVEPPTAWFVARYSIQLSYIRTNKTFLLLNFYITYIEWCGWEESNLRPPGS